jgi:sulfite reductase (NADPH) flavoprotein alpha-component
MSAPVQNLPSFPLDPAQFKGLEAASRTLNPEQLLWASGYLAGLAAARRLPSAASMPGQVVALPGTGPGLTILYGSQTGNSRRVAETAAEAARAARLPVRLQSLGEFPSRQLARESFVLFVVSTQGDGEPPEDAVAFFEFLNSDKAPKLGDLSYGVLALGDSSYPHFCAAGRLLDARLAELGAIRVQDRVDCDLDFASAAESWAASVLKRATELLKHEDGPVPSVVALTSVAGRQAADTGMTVAAELLLNQRLTGRHSSKDVRHLEFLLDGDSLSWQPGDGVSIQPQNPPQLVNAILDALAASGEESLTGPSGNLQPLREILLTEVELTQLHRPLILALHGLTQDARLLALLEDSTGQALANFLASHQVLDLLHQYPGLLDAAGWLAHLRPLGRRTYSIASSPLAHQGELHLLVARVEEDHGDGIRLGAASNHLAALAEGSTLELRLERNASFHLPADDVPLIMIGPGTGVAPFRGYIAERMARGATGRSWLFFGERTQREDFLYQMEWQKTLAQGGLTRLSLAFSRDGKAKTYVQHRILEQARDFHAWLEEGAAIHVCGDASRMAKDVHAAILGAIRVGTGRDEEYAREYLQNLQREGRYRRDVY